jgi:hypothetical protein
MMLYVYDRVDWQKRGTYAEGGSIPMQNGRRRDDPKQCVIEIGRVRNIEQKGCREVCQGAMGL